MKFIFLMCNDLKAIMNFYHGILDLPVVGGSDEDGFVNVDLGIKVVFFKGDYELQVANEFAWQPGYKGGAANVTSFSIELPEKHFSQFVIRALKECAKSLLKPKPEWRRDSYWGITINDPMGNTLEIYTVPEIRPGALVWQ